MREDARLPDIAPASGQFINTQIGKIFVTQTGHSDNPAVLLLHGTGAWGGLWQETSDALAQSGFQALAMDLPPFGFSEHDNMHNYNRRAQAKRVLALIDTLKIKPVLVAHSFGASVGTEAVLISPDSFAGMVIVSGAIGMGSHTNGRDSMPFPLGNRAMRQLLVSATFTNPLLTKTFLSSFIHRKDRATDEYVEILKKPLARAGSTAAVAEWLPYLLVAPKDARSTRPEEYKKLRIPNVALIWGDQDTISPLEQGQDIHSFIQDSTLHVLKDVGHIPQIEVPEEFQKILIGVLENIVSPQE